MRQRRDLNGLSLKTRRRATDLADMILEKKRGSEFGPPLPLWVRCVWVESLQDAPDIAGPLARTVSGNIASNHRLDK